MVKILFIGDIVGESGLRYLEEKLPRYVGEQAIDFVVANCENVFNSKEKPGAGMSVLLVERLFAIGIDMMTGGNHSWDQMDELAVHSDPRLLRPLNYSDYAPGQGAAVVSKEIGGWTVRLGVINVVSRTALPQADAPFCALEAQLAAWSEKPSASPEYILVDFHGESVTEKLTCAFAFDGRVTAQVGTHTHVQTLDSRILPNGTAYVTDTGMTGPSGGMQGYLPNFFIDGMKTRLPPTVPFGLADGPVELGAVLIEAEGGLATKIERVTEF